MEMQTRQQAIEMHKGIVLQYDAKGDISPNLSYLTGRNGYPKTTACSAILYGIYKGSQNPSIQKWVEANYQQKPTCAGKCKLGELL